MKCDYCSLDIQVADIYYYFSTCDHTIHGDHYNPPEAGDFLDISTCLVCRRQE